MDDRRRLLWHGFALLTLAFALGLVAGPLGAQHHPHARLWLGAHTTGILIGIMLIALGLTRPHLQLGPRAARVFFWSAVGGNWIGMMVLGIFNALVGASTPIITPALPPAVGWQAAVIAAGLVSVTISTFTFCVLGLYGLRRSTAAAAPFPTGR